MAKITLPVASCKRNQPLDIFYHNLADFKFSGGVPIDIATDANNTVLTGSFDLTMAEIDLIVANGGKVEQMLSAIMVTDWAALKTMQVPSTLPWYQNMITGVARAFTNWLNQGEVWYNASNQAIFYTNPRSKSADDYLTGAQIKIINDLAICDQITLAVANALIAAGGWVKYS
jgi:hypothetical protein